MFNTNNGYSLSDIAAATGNRGGNGFFGDGNGGWWIIVLFLFMLMGWGGNFGGGFNNNASFPYVLGTSIADSSVTRSDIQHGFDQSALVSSLNGINAGMNAGFANAEVSRCNAQANVLQALNTNQAATVASMNSLAAGLQNCCCEQRAATADLKYTVATENCADRAALSDGVRDILAATQAQTQTIIDKLCQQEIDALKTQNANLQTQLNMANLAASQTAQTARILQDNAAQTSALEQYLNPPAIPAYIVQNPSCCNTYSPCGCGCGGSF